MRSTLHSLKMIFVDEVSMVSSLNLAYMHLDWKNCLVDTTGLVE